MCSFSGAPSVPLQAGCNLSEGWASHTHDWCDYHKANTTQIQMHIRSVSISVIVFEQISQQHNGPIHLQHNYKDLLNVVNVFSWLLTDNIVLVYKLLARKSQLKWLIHLGQRAPCLSCCWLWFPLVLVCAECFCEGGEDKRIPLLKDVFDAFPNTPVNIDIKVNNDTLIKKVCVRLFVSPRVLFGA